METSNRNFGLDLIRSLAISFVVISHSQRLINRANPDFVLFTKVDGVTLFFVLSGFLIGRIIFRSVEGGSWQSLYHFYNRRWWRTLPNYYLFFLLHVIAYLLLGIQDTIDWSSLFFIQNLFSPPGSYFRESWSLAVEEWFYLTFPFIWWLLLAKSKKASLNKYLIYTVVFLLLAWAYKFWFFDNHTVEKPEVFARLPVVFRFSSILWGVLLGIVYLKQKTLFDKGWPWLIAAIVVWIVGDYFFSQMTYVDRSVWKMEFKSLLAALFISTAFSLPSPNSWLRNLVTKMSVYSYSMYLINLPFLAIWRWAVGKLPFESPLFIWSSVIVGWIITFMLSAFVFNKFEKPLTAFRQKEPAKA
jgi:peptidoglycan/LPS O-acetylase OafA/YrhL